jgi:LacI family transcriptional regulator
VGANPSSPQASRSSLSDVARLAGVSPATASRVISGADYPVSATLRAKVEQAARTLGYTPDPVARAMATGRSRTIGVIVGAATDPYFAEVTHGVEERARRDGYLTILCSSDRELDVETAYLRLLREHRAAGAVLVGGAFDDSARLEAFRREVELATEQGMEVVCLAPRPHLAGVPTVSVDDRRMMADLTGYLASLGHRRLAFVGPADGFSTSDVRLAGLRETVAALQLPEPMVLRTGFDYHAGRQAAIRMLEDDLPDAVIGFSDETALGVLMTLRDAGVAVPERVSVAGVDSTREAEFVGLTTISIPMRELGAAAAARIIDPAREAGLAREVIKHRIVPRQTTARRVVPAMAAARA